MNHVKTLSAVTILTCGVLSAGDALARPGFVGVVPNGSQKNCLTCHTRPQGGGGTRNALGAQAQMNLNGVPDWSALFALDADLDGYTNGQEMGDPDGTFPGMPAGAYLSDPADAMDTPCGNGQIDPRGMGAEECDGADVGGVTCADFGGDAGRTPVCAPTCTLDMASCMDMDMPDMNEEMDMSDVGMDMGMPDMSEEMDMDMPDMDTPPEDMGNMSVDMSTDMSTDMPTDMGSGSSDDGSTSPGDGGTPDDGSDAEDEPRCTQVAPGAPTGSWIALLALGALGMVRRRR